MRACATAVQYVFHGGTACGRETLPRRCSHPGQHGAAPTKGGRREAGKVDGRREKEGEEVQRLWGMLYADDAGIVSRSSEELQWMMTVIVTACSSFGLTVSEAKTKIMCLGTKGGVKVSFTINAAGQVY